MWNFFGQDIYDRRVNLNRLRRQIGMVFQKPNPFPSIYDNAYGVRSSRSSSKRGARCDWNLPLKVQLSGMR